MNDVVRSAHSSCNVISYNIRSRMWQREERIRDKRERCLQPDKFAAMPRWSAAENVGPPQGLALNVSYLTPHACPGIILNLRRHAHLPARVALPCTPSMSLTTTKEGIAASSLRALAQRAADECQDGETTDLRHEKAPDLQGVRLELSNTIVINVGRVFGSLPAVTKI